MENITTNLHPGVRKETRNGRDYLVAKINLIVPGTLNGSRGPLYYPRDEIARSVDQWNGIPLVVYHPTHNGSNVSARTPDVAFKSKVGRIYNAHVNKAGILKGEGWFDVDATRRIGPEILHNLERGLPIEVSTGLFTDNQPAPPGSVDEQGRPYSYIARSYRADHLALLPGQKGACSIADGCGVLAGNAHADLKWVTLNGGPGSGNFGHKGRPGQRGGSSSKEAGGNSEAQVKASTDAVWSKLTSAEKGALNDYTTGMSIDLNAALKDAKGDPSKLDDRDLRDLTRHMDTLFDKLPALSKPVAAYRGLSFATEESAKAFTAQLDASATNGKPMSFPGYSSTSVEAKVAEGYLKSREGTGKAAVLLNIKARKGLYVEGKSLVPGSKGEKELILARTAQYRVSKPSVTTSADGTKVYRYDLEEVGTTNNLQWQTLNAKDDNAHEFESDAQRRAFFGKLAQGKITETKRFKPMKKGTGEASISSKKKSGKYTEKELQEQYDSERDATKRSRTYAEAKKDWMDAGGTEDEFLDAMGKSIGHSIDQRKEQDSTFARQQKEAASAKGTGKEDDVRAKQQAEWVKMEKRQAKEATPSTPGPTSSPEKSKGTLLERMKAKGRTPIAPATPTSTVAPTDYQRPTREQWKTMSAEERQRVLAIEFPGEHIDGGTGSNTPHAKGEKIREEYVRKLASAKTDRERNAIQHWYESELHKKKIKATTIGWEAVKNEDTDPYAHIAQSENLRWINLNYAPDQARDERGKFSRKGVTVPAPVPTKPGLLSRVMVKLGLKKAPATITVKLQEPAKPKLRAEQVKEIKDQARKERAVLEGIRLHLESKKREIDHTRLMGGKVLKKSERAYNTLANQYNRASKKWNKSMERLLKLGGSLEGNSASDQGEDTAAFTIDPTTLETAITSALDEIIAEEIRAEQATLNYSPDQLRDDGGRFSNGGSTTGKVKDLVASTYRGIERAVKGVAPHVVAGAKATIKAGAAVIGRSLRFMKERYGNADSILAFTAAAGLVVGTSVLVASAGGLIPGAGLGGLIYGGTYTKMVAGKIAATALGSLPAAALFGLAAVEAKNVVSGIAAFSEGDKITRREGLHRLTRGFTGNTHGEATDDSDLAGEVLKMLSDFAHATNTPEPTVSLEEAKAMISKLRGRTLALNSLPWVTINAKKGDDDSEGGEHVFETEDQRKAFFGKLKGGDIKETKSTKPAGKDEFQSSFAHPSSEQRKKTATRQDEVSKAIADRASDRAKSMSEMAEATKGRTSHTRAADSHDSAAVKHKESAQTASTKELEDYHKAKEKEHDEKAEHHRRRAEGRTDNVEWRTLNNCGIAKGGFQKGNKCAGGGGQDMGNNPSSGTQGKQDANPMGANPGPDNAAQKTYAQWVEPVLGRMTMGTVPAAIAIATGGKAAGKRSVESVNELKEIGKGIFSRMTLGVGPIVAKGIAAGIRHSPKAFNLLVKGMKALASTVKSKPKDTPQDAGANPSSGADRTPPAKTRIANAAPMVKGADRSTARAKMYFDALEKLLKDNPDEADKLAIAMKECLKVMDANPSVQPVSNAPPWVTVNVKEGKDFDSDEQRRAFFGKLKGGDIKSTKSTKSVSEKPAKSTSATKLKGVSDKDPKGMSAAQINKELDTLDEHSSKNTDRFIEAGRGHEKPSDYLHESKDDELSRTAQTISKRRRALKIEVELRAGESMRRLPKGFGPRKTS